jgi:hypothetical protein
MDRFRSLSPPLKLANYAPYSCPNFHPHHNLQTPSYSYSVTAIISAAHPEASEFLIKACRCVIFSSVWPPGLKNELREPFFIQNAWTFLQRVVHLLQHRVM